MDLSSGWRRSFFFFYNRYYKVSRLNLNVAYSLLRKRFRIESFKIKNLAIKRRGRVNNLFNRDSSAIFVFFFTFNFCNHLRTRWRMISQEVLVTGCYASAFYCCTFYTYWGIGLNYVIYLSYYAYFYLEYWLSRKLEFNYV